MFYNVLAVGAVRIINDKLNWKMETTKKDLEYYRKNAEEDYLTTPISVLRYISEMEAALRQPPVVGRSEQLKAFVDEYIEAWEDGNGGDSYLYRKAKSL